MKNGTVRLMMPGQFKDVAAAILQAIPTNVSYEAARRVIGSKKLMRKVMETIFGADAFIAEQIAVWEQIYGKDFSDLRIPEMREGFDQLIVVAEGMTPNGLFAKVKELMPAWRYTDNLDTVVSDRTAKNGDYAIWVRKRIEADEELKNQSANDLHRNGVLGNTLEERLAYELYFFKTTGKHLDVENITLCSGSRWAAGRVPHVGREGGGVGVGWYRPSRAHDYLRSRAAVV